MSEKRRRSDMLMPTVIMGALAFILVYIGYSKGAGAHITGIRLGMRMIIETAPLLVFAFIIAGMAQVVLPREALVKWLGAEAGFKGIMIGTVAGGFAPGGPYVSLPLVAGLLRSGASVGAMVAFLTSWLLWAATRLPMEVGILGWRFTLARLASTFFFPPIAGLIAQTLFRNFK